MGKPMPKGSEIGEPMREPTARVSLQNQVAPRAYLFSSRGFERAGPWLSHTVGSCDLTMALGSPLDPPVPDLAHAFGPTIDLA